MENAIAIITRSNNRSMLNDYQQHFQAAIMSQASKMIGSSIIGQIHWWQWNCNSQQNAAAERKMEATINQWHWQQHQQDAAEVALAVSDDNVPQLQNISTKKQKANGGNRSCNRCISQVLNSTQVTAKLKFRQQSTGGDVHQGQQARSAVGQQASSRTASQQWRQWRH